MAKECDITARWWLPLIRQLTNAHRHRFYPDKDVTKLFTKDRHYLLAVTPHGFFPWGVAGIIVELLNQGYLPNFVGASVLGKLPVAGRLLRYYGYKPATPEAIRECLAKEYPRNVTIIIPGGISEMFKIREDVEVSCANTRLGFVRLAKEQGAMLVPGYMLGNSQLYQVAKGFLGQLFENISRRLKTSITLFHGRWGTLLPYPQKLACALGEPIDTRLCATVEEAHKKWIKGLCNAYNAHKDEFGWSGRRLYFEGETLPARPADPLEAYTTLPRLSKL
ncbi:DGAT2D [Symbiodinium sp. CCMP2592]|nr:DGAT2D [Symbiodinium sp. CCMP2592]